jgi:hypothetical protein
MLLVIELVPTIQGRAAGVVDTAGRSAALATGTIPAGTAPPPPIDKVPLLAVPPAEPLV